MFAMQGPSGIKDGFASGYRQTSDSKAESRGPTSEAGDALADDSERQRHKKGSKPQNWKGKGEVLEQVNELIAELDTIAGSIASQVKAAS